MRFWHAYETSRLCLSRLGEMGLTIEVTVDPGRVLWSVEGSGKPYLTPWLDPYLNDFNERNFFWLIAKKSDEPVIVGGGRLDSLSMDGDWAIHRMFQRGYGQQAVVAVNPEVRAIIDGRACYLGDLYSRTATGMARKATRYYLGLANFLAAHQLDADVVYSFMRESDVRRGSADTNGLDARIYNPVQWGDVPDARDTSEIIVYRDIANNSAYFDGLKRELANSGSVLMNAPESQRPAIQA